MYQTNVYKLDFTSQNIVHPFKYLQGTFYNFSSYDLSVFANTKKDFLVMFGLVDMWTSETAKLREKGQTMFSNGSSLTNAESRQSVQAKQESSIGLVPAFSRFMRVNSPVVLYSEVSVSMLECSRIEM